MDSYSTELSHLPAFIEKMNREGLGHTVIDSFIHYYRKVVQKDTGMLPECRIEPLDAAEIDHFENIDNYAQAGKQLLPKTAILILNGGLGTSMGLIGPKSLLEVRDGKTFLDLKLAQAQNSGVFPVLMNSFSTHGKTLNRLDKIPSRDRPLFFLQDKFPKILQKDLSPAKWDSNPALEWNPPGHGNIYTALFSSKIIYRLLDRGIRHAFICNSDNLGARVNESILGYFAQKGYPFMMEVAQRSSQDAKGGHLARHKNGSLILREVAQCPAEELHAFQDTGKYSFFNTNNLWLDLAFLKNFMEKHKTIQLPMILKTVKLDPRNDSSPDIFQVETAMGAAISTFEGTHALSVPKSRFIPVKGTNDLLIVKSDCFAISENKQLILNPLRNEMPGIRICLDPRYFRKIDMFNDRFRQGVPSLLKCVSIEITGDVFFEANVTIEGSVHIKNSRQSPVTIKKGTVVDKDLFF